MNTKRLGFMTTELMVVAIVLAILSGISASAVPTFANRAKRSALSSTLAVLQGATDRFFVEANVYPVATQPVARAKAIQINPDAQDPAGNKLVGTYLHSAPNPKAVDYGFNSSEGSTVYFGVTATGRVFATQVEPLSGEWADGTIRVYTQENVDGTLTLSMIW